MLPPANLGQKSCHGQKIAHGIWQPHPFCYILERILPGYLCVNYNNKGMASGFVFLVLPSSSVNSVIADDYSLCVGNKSIKRCMF